MNLPLIYIEEMADLSAIMTIITTDSRTVRLPCESKQAAIDEASAALLKGGRGMMFVVDARKTEVH